MKVRVKKVMPYFLAISAGIFLLLFLIYLGFKDEDVNKSSNDTVSKKQYALVNEDRGATFEGKYFSLGSDFVTLINKDTVNRWETTTRNIATSGVENGQFDAQIIIPQDFSEKLLSLQAIAPEKAQIEYQVRDGQNEITNQMIQIQVNDILRDFNQRVIQMYFSSIIGNLTEAQQNVNRIVNDQQIQQTSIENKVFTPFSEIPDNYLTVLNTASILDEDNKLFTVEQEAFVKSVQALLESNNKSLETSSESTEGVKKIVDDYSKEANEKIKKSIEQFNDQFEMHKKQIASQWQNDTEKYKNQFDQLNLTAINQFANFYTPNANGDSGVYAEFLKESKLFQETQANRIKELQSQITELQTQVEQLIDLKKQIAKTYFNDAEATPDSATDEQIKKAIVQLISNEKNNTPNLESNYNERLEDTLSKISYDSLERLIEELKNNGVLTEDQADIFNDELKIVKKYANDFDKDLGSEVQFMYLEPKQIHADMIEIPTEKVTLSIDTTTENNISLRENDSADKKITFNMNDQIFSQIESQLRTQLEDTGYSVDIIGISDTEFMITQPTKFENETTNQLEETSKEEELQENTLGTKTDESPLPKKLTFTIDIPLTWRLTSEQQKTSYNCIEFSWWVNNDLQAKDSFSVYIPMDQPLVQDIPMLMEQFQLLDITAQQIVTIYGSPNTNLSIQDYAEMIEKPDNQEKTIEELAAEDSIYWMYDNITESEQVALITDKLVNKYRATGTQLYQDAKEQINNLQNLIGTEIDQNTMKSSPTLYGTLNLMVVPEKLLQEADKLNAWFTEATKQVNTIYGSWKETEKVEANSVISNNNQHPEENNPSTVNNETEGLVKAMNLLMKTSKETSEKTKDSAAKVKDVAPKIKELKASTKKVQNNAKDILTNLNDSIDESKKTNKENEDYAKTFEKVLSNTKNGGADNPQVFNFLSSPIQGQGIFGETREVSLIPYYATLIGAILTLIIAMVLQSLTKKRIVTKEDFLIEPTRVWQNIPNIVLILITVILLATVYSVMLIANIVTDNKLAWFSYSFLVFMSCTLLILGFMRQFKKTTLYVYGALLGLFFMLTPLLGITTKTGSLSNLLYRFSPLQNIQNGFTFLINGGKIGWLTYLVLVILLILGIVLNLFVQPEEKKRGES